MLSVAAVRVAEPQDVPLLAEIEAEGDAQFADVLDTSVFGPCTPGAERVASGVVLVIGSPAVGFAHLIELADGPLILALGCGDSSNFRRTVFA